MTTWVARCVAMCSAHRYPSDGQVNVGKKVNGIHPVMATVFASVARPHGGVRACAMNEYQWRRRFVSAGDDKGAAVA